MLIYTLDQADWGNEPVTEGREQQEEDRIKSRACESVWSHHDINPLTRNRDSRAAESGSLLAHSTDCLIPRPSSQWQTQKDTEREDVTRMMKDSKGTSLPMLLLQQSLARSTLGSLLIPDCLWINVCEFDGTCQDGFALCLSTERQPGEGEENLLLLLSETLSDAPR